MFSEKLGSSTKIHLPNFHYNIHLLITKQTIVIKIYKNKYNYYVIYSIRSCELDFSGSVKFRPISFLSIFTITTPYFTFEQTYLISLPNPIIHIASLLHMNFFIKKKLFLHFFSNLVIQKKENMQKPILIFIIASVLHACTSKIVKPSYLKHCVELDKMVEIENKHERFKQQVIGHFSNKRQVEQDPLITEKEQEFVVVPIFRDRPNEFWVYLEYFSPSVPEVPFEQRVQEYVRINRDTVLVRIYHLKNPEKYLNAWCKPDNNILSKLSKDELILNEGCNFVFGRDKEDKYVFNTVPFKDVACEMTSSTSARYFNLHFQLKDEGYSIVFDFFDKDKKLLRRSSPIKFDRLNYKSKGYRDYTKIWED